MDKPWLSQKSNNRTPLGFRSGKPFLPIIPRPVYLAPDPDACPFGWWVHRVAARCCFFVLSLTGPHRGRPGPQMLANELPSWVWLREVSTVSLVQEVTKVCESPATSVVLFAKLPSPPNCPASHRSPRPRCKKAGSGRILGIGLDGNHYLHFFLLIFQPVEGRFVLANPRKKAVHLSPSVIYFALLLIITPLHRFL